MSDKEKKCSCGCDEHGHDHDCDCGCNMEDEIVELTTEDGKKLKFYFVGTIEYKGKNYSAFERYSYGTRRFQKCIRKIYF